MTVLTADIEAHTAELSESAFEAFCDDMGAMFDADVTCTRQGVGTGTVREVQKHFKKLTAVHHVQATGTLSGTFHLLFDQGGLFTLSGVIVMLPEQRILEEIRRGSIDQAETLTDAAREVGNLLVGAWDRVFREECEGHDHFLKTGTFIGKPWENLDEVGLGADEELVFVLCDMTVESYPSFRCAAIFPKTMFTGAPPAEAADQSDAQAAEEQPVAELQQEMASAPATIDPEPAASAPPTPGAQALETPSSPSEETNAGPQALTESDPSEESTVAAGAPSEPVAAPVDADPLKTSPIPEDIRSTVEAVVGPVGVAAPATPAPKKASSAQASSAGSLDRMFNDLVEYSRGTGVTELLRVQAREILVPEVVWSAPEDTVKDVLAKMQQHNSGYVLIGQNGVLEGLVSNSNILGAVSPYLRPMFAKWRRPEDDATLRIKIKWIMSRPVRTIRPDTTLASMIESMRRCGGRCLPVVDSQGKVEGIVTVFDILLRVLEADKSFSWQGRPPQAPPLLI